MQRCSGNFGQVHTGHLALEFALCLPRQGRNGDLVPLLKPCETFLVRRAGKLQFYSWTRKACSVPAANVKTWMGCSPGAWDDTMTKAQRPGDAFAEPGPEVPWSGIAQCHHLRPDGIALI